MIFAVDNLATEEKCNGFTGSDYEDIQCWKVEALTYTLQTAMTTNLFRARGYATGPYICGTIIEWFWDCITI